MKIIAITPFVALLGACSTTPPPQDSASVNTSGNYIVVQDGTTYTLQTVFNSTSNGVSVDSIRVGASGNETAFGFSNADVTAVGGQADGAYITGLSGTQTVGMASSGILNLSGKFGFNDNGSNETGITNLTADLGAGSFAGTGSFGTTVAGTINGATVSGTITRFTTTGTLNGGFYGSAAAPTMAATITGTNIAGILVVN